MEHDTIWLALVFILILVIAYFIWRSNSNKPEQLEDRIEEAVDNIKDDWKKK